MKITPISIFSLNNNNQKRTVNNSLKLTYPKDSVSFSGKHKPPKKEAEFFEEDIKTLKEDLLKEYDKTGKLSFSVLPMIIGYDVEIKPIEELNKDYLDSEKIVAQANEHSDLTVTHVNGIPYVEKIKPGQITLYLSSLDKPKTQTIQDIAHEYTHILQYRKTPAKEASLIVDNLKAHKMNFGNVVINVGRLYQDGLLDFEVNNKNEIFKFYNIQKGKSVIDDFREIESPAKDLEKAFGAVNKKDLERILAQKLDNEITEVSEYLIENLPELNAISKKNPAHTLKAIKQTFKAVYISSLEKEYAAYSNGCKVAKEINGIDYNIPYDTIVELYKKLAKSSELLGY